jgi:twinkle protein
MDDDSSFIRKEPCPACGSRDNLARYSDGHAFCFGCDHYEPGDGSPSPSQHRRKITMEDALTGTFVPLKARAITEETCRKFGYMVGTNRAGKAVQIAPYYDADGNLVGQKTRTADKEFKFLGSSKDAILFGQHLWPSSGRRVVVTEGEIDCMAVSQAQGNKWPVVSIPNGAQGAKKSLAKQLEWLNGFEEVVLCFDMDEPGRKAMAECVSLFPAGKAKTVELPRKDPGEMLAAGEGDKLVNCIWSAKTHRPDGIVTLGDIKADLLKPVEIGLPWWSSRLTELTYGRRYGELYAFGAGTGIGKTDWLTQQIVFDIVDLNQPVALFFLEQQPKETGKRVAGKMAGRRFHVPNDGWTDQELIDAIEKLEASGKLFLYDSFGVTDWESIRETMRFLHHSEGIRIFYLDHLTALAATAEDERKALEEIMAEMGGIVKELDCILHIVSHLATPEGKPHEEGGRVMIRHFKGSRAIGFWCAYMFGLERDQQHEDERFRSITTFRVLKDRYTGQATGEVIYLGYDRDTGRLFETELPEENGPFKDETTGDDCPF